MCTKFFHPSIVIRRRNNRINEIKLDNGNMLYGREPIGEYFTNHFKNLYQLVKSKFHQNIVVLINTTISGGGNDNICKVFIGPIKIFVRYLFSARGRLPRHRHL